MDLLPVIIVYTGLLGSFIAAVSVAKPLRVWPFYTRKRALLIFAGALIGALVGLLLPQSVERINAPSTLLDQFMPAYLVHEIHEAEVRATHDQVYAAIRAVTPREIALFHTLTWPRRLVRGDTPGILNPPDATPMLDTFIRGGFLLLAEEPGQEVVIGAVMSPASPNWKGGKASRENFKALPAVKAAMNFRAVEVHDAVCRVMTETRVSTSSAHGRRVFAAYWRVIYPGSAMIRRMWLRAIQRRAEANGSL